MVGRPSRRGGTIDLLFLRRRVGDSDDPASASELAGDLERAARLLGPAGVVIIVIEPDRRSGHDVTDGTEGAAAGEAAALGEALDRSGFRERHRFVRYPDRGPDLAVVSEQLWDRPTGAGMLQLIVRDPVRPPAPGSAVSETAVPCSARSATERPGWGTRIAWSWQQHATRPA